MLGSCYLCGEDGAEDREHVFGRLMFPIPRPENLLTAPAHRSCNQGFQSDEEYFRTFALSGLPNEAARILWEGPVRRSFNRQPAFQARLASQIGREDIHSRGGIYLGSVETFQAEADRINRVLAKHVRGLA